MFGVRNEQCLKTGFQGTILFFSFPHCHGRSVSQSLSSSGILILSIRDPSKILVWVCSSSYTLRGAALLPLPPPSLPQSIGFSVPSWKWGRGRQDPSSFQKETVLKAADFVSIWKHSCLFPSSCPWLSASPFFLGRAEQGSDFQ